MGKRQDFAVLWYDKLLTAHRVKASNYHRSIANTIAMLPVEAVCIDLEYGNMHMLIAHGNIKRVLCIRVRAGIPKLTIIKDYESPTDWVIFWDSKRLFYKLFNDLGVTA